MILSNILMTRGGFFLLLECPRCPLGWQPCWSARAATGVVGTLLFFLCATNKAASRTGRKRILRPVKLNGVCYSLLLQVKEIFFFVFLGLLRFLLRMGYFVLSLLDLQKKKPHKSPLFLQKKMLPGSFFHKMRTEKTF